MILHVYIQYMCVYYICRSKTDNIWRTWNSHIHRNQSGTSNCVWISKSLICSKTFCINKIKFLLSTHNLGFHILGFYHRVQWRGAKTAGNERWGPCQELIPSLWDFAQTCSLQIERWNQNWNGAFQEREPVSPVSPFHWLVRNLRVLSWCWCGCWGLFVCCFGWFALFDVSGLSFRSSCLTMTTLAQLHDCHSCNDERSIVQKKSIGLETDRIHLAWDWWDLRHAHGHAGKPLRLPGVRDAGKDNLTDVWHFSELWIQLLEEMAALVQVLLLSHLLMLRVRHPPRQGLSCRVHALANQQAETELSHGGMRSQRCPNVGSLVSCAEHPAIAPWVSTFSAWQMTILRTCVVSTTYTSSMVSRLGGAYCDAGSPCTGAFVAFLMPGLQLPLCHQSLQWIGSSRLTLGLSCALGDFPLLKWDMCAGGCQNKTAEYGYLLSAQPPGDCDANSGV